MKTFAIYFVSFMVIIFRLSAGSVKGQDGVKSSKVKEDWEDHPKQRKPDHNARKVIDEWDVAAKCCPNCQSDCEKSVERRDPKFYSAVQMVNVLAEHHKGRTYIPYNSTTYPGDPTCPCRAFTYSISSIEGSKPDDSDDVRKIFRIEPHTGRLYLENHVVMGPNEMYVLTITVRNRLTGASDEMTLSLSSPKRITDMFSPFEGDKNGFEGRVFDDVNEGREFDDVLSVNSEPHSRHRRAAYTPVPDVTFNLTQLNSVTEIRVGSRVQFQLEIEFPNTTVDMLVELFAPDDNVTVMILDDVKVVISTNLDHSYNDTPVLESMYGNIYQPDRAILAFGNVSKIADPATRDDMLITITYEAVMIENNFTDSGTYWVSAGAEFLQESYIWVGQASFDAIVDGNMTVDTLPEFNVTMPVNIALGTSFEGTIDMFIPFPMRDYVLQIFTPADEVGLMSVCWVQPTFSESDFGPNFQCGNNYGQVTTGLKEEQQAIGNAVGEVNFGKLLNKGSRDEVHVLSESLISVDFIAHLYPDATKVGQTIGLGFALEVDSQNFWVGNGEFTISAAATTGLSNPTLNSATPGIDLTSATIGEPFSIVYNISVPVSAVASHYVLEALAPRNATDFPIFSVCSLKVTFIGENMPCHRTSEMITEFSSVDPLSSEPDTAKVDMGYITNLGKSLGPDSGDIIVEAVFRPLADSPDAAISSSHTVTFGVSVGGSFINIFDSTVTLTQNQSVLPISNLTAPNFLMEYWNGIDDINVNGNSRIDVTMMTSRNTTYDEFDMEFIMPTSTDTSLMHVCRVDIVKNGKNMPCMSPEWYNKKMQYLSQFKDKYNDRAKLTLGNMCNVEMSTNDTEDETMFSIYFRIKDVPEVTDLSSHYVSTGLLYSSTQLWVGQLKVDATRGVEVGPVSIPNRQFVAYNQNTSYNPLPGGLAKTDTITLKINRSSSADVTVVATSLDPNLHICSVRVVAAGLHMPCISDSLVTRTTTYWPGNVGFESVTAYLGHITNYGDSSGVMTSNGLMDHDSVQIEVVVRANPNAVPSTYGYTATAYVNTAKTSALSWSMSVTTTDSYVSITQSETHGPVSASMSMGEIAGGDNSTDVTFGEVRKVMMDIVIPENSEYDIEVSFGIPSGDVGKLEICDAAIVSAGANVPCVDKDMDPLLTSLGGTYYDTATFALSYVCSKPIYPGDEEENTVRFAVYVRVVPNGLAAVNDVVQVSGSVRTFTSTVTVGTFSLTVADLVNFVDKYSQTAVVANTTLISLFPQPNVIPMLIGQNLTLNVTVTIPAYSSSKFLFDVELPTDGTSACMTVNDVRVIGSPGRNVLCVEPSVNDKGVVYTPAFNDTLGTGQNTYVFLDVGIVTNTGLTYTRKAEQQGDDDVILEVDIQMADCSLSSHGAIHKLSIGNKVANYIFIYDHDVEIDRVGDEEPRIFVELNNSIASTSSSWIVEGVAYHLNTSQAEGINTSIVLQFPTYMIPQTTFIASIKPNCDIISDSGDPAILEIWCDRFYFTDIYTFTVRADVNVTAFVPVGYNVDPSIAYCEVKTEFLSAFHQTAASEPWFPVITTNTQSLEISGIVAGAGASCNTALGMETGAIADCQISGSDTKNVGTHLSLGPAPADLEKLYTSGTVARGVRIFISNDTALLQKPNVGIKFELYGCLQSSDMTAAAACQVVAGDATVIPTDFNYRSFIEMSNGEVVVCDRKVDRARYIGQCYRSASVGTRFEAVEPNLATLVGIESSQNRVYGYAQDKTTVMVSVDDGVTWQATMATVLAADKLMMDWADAIAVPETDDVNLDQVTPHLAFTQGQWGATYTGMHVAGTKVLEWSSTQ
ncbi:hypothetical protein MAR_010815 [Mya arenaria]|uniref:Uncharacterized protein n=1 Tax=Mya arenaria TaxID=6604 RepID=A0ABY7FW94_MYAAR|nr:hypothetical protein MAR_010815 [Mya arenaria]